MSYKHILVAIDLSPESKILISKAILIAKLNKAKISLIHVNINYSDLYTGLIDVNISNVEKKNHKEFIYNELIRFIKESNFKFNKIINSNGDLVKSLIQSITIHKIDLVIFGHHQDFWSKFISYVRQFINSVPIDMLIVPL
ncbi:universal stress protein [Buchnera aphidicola (Neophyllaphis podocarpi)]|uniref:universal stress protein n=1 Tax=Buchnera aphidicola TaxID=9 RepID=UPI0031B7EDE5